MKNTRLLADKAVDLLTSRLRSTDLPAFRSIYVCGSYCRGDWLNCSSDLDIHMIINDSGSEYRESNLDYIKSIVTEAIGEEGFLSHCPGGIEYGFSYISDIPKTSAEACSPSPYAYFSTLMYDLKEHHLTIYGDEINTLLPDSPDPKANARDWLLMLVERTKSLSIDDFRLPFNVYKAIIAAQLHHGEVTVNKYKILELYQRCVPEFSMKWFGELVIRNYVGSFYPDRPPMQFSHVDYLRFIHGLMNITGIYNA